MGIALTDAPDARPLVGYPVEAHANPYGYLYFTAASPEGNVSRLRDPFPLPLLTTIRAGAEVSYA